MNYVSYMHDSAWNATDLFCGAGGSSTGLVQAGLRVDMAANHWPLAIETHNTNHPNTDHDCANISRADPKRYPRTQFLWASPECVTHSLARGKGRNIESEQQDLFVDDPQELEDEAMKRSRATMGDVVRFARQHRYTFIIVENVVDIKRWEMFDDWKAEVHKLGYWSKEVYLNSMFADPGPGADWCPQSRDRIYVVFWRKGNPAPDLDIRPLAHCPNCARDVHSVQTWKKGKKGKAKTWGKYGRQYTYNCPGCGRVLTPYYYAAFNCIDWSVQAPMIKDRPENKQLKPRTMNRIRYGLRTYGRQPLLITTRYTSGTSFRVKDAATSPLPTQPTDVSHAILTPIKHSHAGDRRSSSIFGPMPTQTTQQSHALALPPSATMSLNYPNQPGKPTSKPLDAITTTRPFALISINQYGDKKGVSGPDQPVPTVTTTPGRFGAAFIPELFGRSTAKPVTSPLGCVTASPQNYGVCNLPSSPFIAEMHGTSNARGLEEPLLCVAAGGQHHALIQPSSFISYYNGTHNASGLADPIRTMMTVDRAALVQVPPAPGPDALKDEVDAWVETVIQYCTFRMLGDKEIQRAMAFPNEYVVLGNKRQRVRQLGNGVTPPVAHLLGARCIQSIESITQAYGDLRCLL